VALRLLDELEPTGWITEDFFLISAELKCSIEELELVIRKLQEIEPAWLILQKLERVLNFTSKRFKPI
jgi:DNA-directed RNA polymerase specialized sigma54-like protein